MQEKAIAQRDAVRAWGVILLILTLALVAILLV
jgi:hypothetical protein